MNPLELSIGEPFTSPAWGSNFVVFSGAEGRIVPEEETKEYLRKCCKYAKYHKVHLVPERFVMMNYLCLCLISPQGKVLGAQQAVYLNTKGGEYARGSSMVVVSTEFGGIFLCVDVDVFRPEVSRIAAEMGAQYLICVQEIADRDYTTQMVVNGVWNAAQSNNIIAVGASNQYHCVCAPISLTESKDGFLAKPTTKMPLTRTLDAGELSRCKKRRPLSRKLYAVHREELLG